MNTQSRCRIAAIALVAATTIESQAQVAATPSSTADFVEVVQRDAERKIDVSVGGKPFTSYLYSPSVKRPLLYPLRAAGGAVVTLVAPTTPARGARAMPPEEAGLWFNYGDVNGVDFSTPATPSARTAGPRVGSVVHRAVRSVRGGDGEGSIEVTVEWLNAQGKALLKEDVHFIIRAHEGFRSIDRVATVTALDTAVTFTNNGRALVGVRVSRALESLPMEGGGLEPMTPRSSSPERDTSHAAHRAMTVHADPERPRGWWTLLTGPVASDTVTFVVLDHPRNVSFPTHWNPGESGLAATNQARTTGASARTFRLEAGESTTLSHQVLIVNRALPADELEKYYAGFTAPKP